MHFSRLRTSIAVPAIAALLVLAPGAEALPTSISSLVSSVNTSIQPRFIPSIALVDLYLAVKEYLKDANAYVSLSHYVLSCKTIPMFERC